MLCATHRLARNLRRERDRDAAAQGLATWRPLDALTLPQWLERVCGEALLAGELPAEEAPAAVLTPAQERVLWERAIEADFDREGGAGNLLFDREGLARAAAEANALVEGWGLSLAGESGEETRRFLRWRAEFRRRCAASGWLEPARALAWQVGAVERGAGRLPARIRFAGFDRTTPQERRLAQALAARGCEVADLDLGLEAEAKAASVALPDRAAECRAVAAWVAARLDADPSARLGIVVPDLAGVRDALAAALDDPLHPQAAAPGGAELPRRYNFSLGPPLARVPLVAVALSLLRLAANGRRVEQTEFGDLLRGPYWSAFESEADTRARLDARMRETLSSVFSVERLLRFLRRQAGRGLTAPRLLADLEALRAQAAAAPARRLPSEWAAHLSALLAAAGWPGERGLSSHEFQAREAFREVVASLAQFDGVLGRVALAGAVGQLSKLARDRVFQPETPGDPPVQVMGPLEAAGARFDALWVMGMNDDVWPAAAAPNPLLPADVQRRAGTPAASAEIEGAFAAAIHRRLLRSAPEAFFSWAQGEGDRQRRPSPLIAGLPPCDAPALLPTLVERLTGAQAMEALDDSRAPPVSPGERIAGGTGLLKAQAICPAWAYYRYRLGARPLGEPVEGLDALGRGSLLHAVMERFWRGRDSAGLAAMATGERESAVALAVDQALAAFNAQRDEPLPPRIVSLERERLSALVGDWLGIELSRPAPFRVAACEETHEIAIKGLVVRLVADRIDELEDGRRVLIDYKTGRELDWGSWAEVRIAEPQLPVYAAFASGDAPVDAVAFARLRAGESRFVGLSAEGELLPEVPGLAEKDARKKFPEADFPDWDSVIAHWRRAVAAVARELAQGDAAVRFEDEKALMHCEVKPLLRLAERRGQMESGE